MGAGIAAPRIICIGANLESKIALEALLQAGAQIAGVVTVPAQSQAGISDYVDLHELCGEHCIPTVDTTDINSPQTLTQLRALSPDFLFTLGWSSLFGSDVLATPTHYVVGSHPSALPFGRGRAPVPWTILQGLDKSAVTLFKMDLGVDAGPIVWQEWFDVAPRATAWDLYQQVAQALAKSFVSLHEAITHGTVHEIPQDLSVASVRCKRTPADGHVDFRTMTAADVDRLIRAVGPPFPGAYSYHQGERVILLSSNLEETPDYVGAPGQILTRRRGRLLVQCVDQPVWIEQLEFTTSKRTLREVPLGSKFGYCLEDEIYALRQELEALKTRS